MTARTIVARITPPALVGRRRAVHILERNYVSSKAVWSVILSGFFEPLFYLFAIGVGIGQLAGDIELPGGEVITYAAYVAPALLAASAMNGAVLESTINIFFKLKYGKTYDAILATPMQPADVAVGEIGWSLVRGGLYAIAFFAVMLVLGLVLSPWGVLAVPAALLIGFGFAGVGMAASTYMRTWQDLDLVNLILLPMFLFSGTFFPIDIYPPVLQVVTRLSPLYHAVLLVRGLTLGNVGPALIVHAAYLAAMGAIGLAIANRRISAMLLK
jgi:lipooligosaccharide transport system permease protein